VTAKEFSSARYDELFRIKAIEPATAVSENSVCSMITWLVTLTGIIAFSWLAVVRASGTYAGMAALSVLLGFIAVVGCVRYSRRGWRRIGAKVLDQEIVRIGLKQDYTFRLLCEIQFGGETLQVTPMPNWQRKQLAGTEAILAKAIDHNQQCWLWVNPEDPRQADLSLGGIRDFAIFGYRQG